MKSIYLVLFFSVFFTSCKKDDSPIIAEDHFEAEGLFLLNTKNDTVIYYFQGQLFGNDTIFSSLNISSDNLSVKFMDKNKVSLEPPIDEPDHNFNWVIGDSSIVKFEFVNNNKYLIKHTGKKFGATNVEFQLLHNEHPDFRTISIPIKVE